MVHSFYSSAQPSGENTVVLNEVDALRRAGHTVELFAAHTDELEDEVLYKLRAGLRVATGYGRSPLKAINDFGADVVHIHNLFPNFGSKWVEDLKVPMVHTVHNYRPMCANGVLFREDDVCTLCVGRNSWPAVRNSCYRGSRTSTVPMALSMQSGSSRTLIRRADVTIFLSEKQKALFEAADVSPVDCAISGNFLPKSLEPLPTSEGPERNGWLGVGRLSSEKGFEQLAAHWPSDERLRIVGEGEGKGELLRQAHAGVEVLGGLARPKVLSLMRRSEGLIFPSRWFECLPLVYLESLANGLPVVAFEPNAVAALVNDQGTGFSLTWSDSIAATLRRVRGRHEELIENCRRVFKAVYSEEAYLRRATAIYTRVTKSVVS